MNACLYERLPLFVPARIHAAPGSHSRQAIYFLQDEVAVAAGGSVCLQWRRVGDTKLTFALSGGSVVTRHAPPGTQVVQCLYGCLPPLTPACMNACLH